MTEKLTKNKLRLQVKEMLSPGTSVPKTISERPELPNILAFLMGNKNVDLKPSEENLPELPKLPEVESQKDKKLYPFVGAKSGKS